MPGVHGAATSTQHGVKAPFHEANCEWCKWQENGGGKYIVRELFLKCQLNSHVEILLAGPVNSDVPVNREKASKTNPLGKS